MRYLVVFVLVSGCTCFTPVDELDGGAGGGAGGGGGGGAGGGGGSFADGGCAAPSDCVGTPANVSWCGVAGGLGWSCVGGQCLWECNGGRVCEVTSTPDGGCLACAGAATRCRAQLFCGTVPATGQVESSTCGLAGAVDFTAGDAGCHFVVSGDAGVFGSIEELQGGQFLADLPAQGGRCTGTVLPTGLERWVLNCPACQLVVSF